MKKFISLMICVAMILSSVGAMADSDSLIVNTVKVNVSSGSVTLNDEECLFQPHRMSIKTVIQWLICMRW